MILAICPFDGGGMTKSSGVSQRIQVTTVQPGSSRVFKDVDTTDLAATASVQVYDGDMVVGSATIERACRRADAD